MPPFEVVGADVSQRRVQSVGIVEAFDVLSHGVLGLAPRRPRLAVDELGLERREEALSDRVDAPMSRRDTYGGQIGQEHWVDFADDVRREVQAVDDPARNEQPKRGSAC